MEKDKAAKKAKLEREKALSAASKAQQGVAGNSSNGRQDAPWLHPGITVKVSAIVPRYGLNTKSMSTKFLARSESIWGSIGQWRPEYALNFLGELFILNLRMAVGRILRPKFQRVTVLCYYGQRWGSRACYSDTSRLDPCICGNKFVKRLSWIRDASGWHFEPALQAFCRHCIP